MDNELKFMFCNLVELTEEPNFKLEWSDKDNKRVDKAIKDLFQFTNLKDHNEITKRMYTLQDIENFFGLPYTSSSSYAMLSNTNVRYCIDKAEKFNIEYFALSTDNEVIMFVCDNDENYRMFIIS